MLEEYYDSLASILVDEGLAQTKKVSIGKRKFHWDVLGLENPAETLSTSSIENVRRQIISASNHGLSPETPARSRKKDERLKPKSKAPTDLLLRPLIR